MQSMDPAVRPPMFMSFGTILPHPPWLVPQEFMDLYHPENLTLPEHRMQPKNVPSVGRRRMGEGMGRMGWV